MEDSEGNVKRCLDLLQSSKTAFLEMGVNWGYGKSSELGWSGILKMALRINVVTDSDRVCMSAMIHSVVCTRLNLCQELIFTLLARRSVAISFNSDLRPISSSAITQLPYKEFVILHWLYLKEDCRHLPGQDYDSRGQHTASSPLCGTTISTSRLYKRSTGCSSTPRSRCVGISLRSKARTKSGLVSQPVVQSSLPVVSNVACLSMFSSSEDHTGATQRQKSASGCDERERWTQRRPAPCLARGIQTV
nr:hypothetical protein Iba_chr11cCG12480 [Ipomoea batatas]